jgi:hypothetical protein
MKHNHTPNEIARMHLSHPVAGTAILPIHSAGQPLLSVIDNAITNSGRKLYRAHERSPNMTAATSGHTEPK